MANYWSVVLIYLRVRGITHALGCNAYLSVWWEVGALHVVCLALFAPSFPHPLLSTLYQCDRRLSCRGMEAHGWVVRFFQPLVQSPLRR